MILTRTRQIALFWILLSSAISIAWGISLDRASRDGMGDFKGIYYDARCLMQGVDPYKQGEPLRIYLAEREERGLPSDVLRRTVGVNVYLPTTSIFVVPFALLPYKIAHYLWMILTAGVFIFSACLIWDFAANSAPVISGVLICFILANSEAFFATGNSAGIVISFCIIAVWCFLKDRFVPIGILCMALSLSIKPHDAGLVWLYFLLAGTIYRKRALQTLLVTTALATLTLLWVVPIAPHWMQELHTNILVNQLPGEVNDPGPITAATSGPSMVLSLQSTVSVFRDDPLIYNSVSYLICGALLVIWGVRTLRSQFSPQSAWLALAAVVPLTLLVTYHRPYDGKLLLLAVPAFAMLWTEKGAIRWVALLVSVAGFISVADIPLTIFILLTRASHVPTMGFSGQILKFVLMRPTPLILLTMGIFYLWVYLRHDSGCTVPTIDPAQ
jgi:hypothetical protein